MTERVIICADHGLALIYFLNSEVISLLLSEGIEVILLTDDSVVNKIRAQYPLAGLIVKGLQLDSARKYYEENSQSTQYWLNFFRRVGASEKMNTEALDSHIQQIETESLSGRNIQKIILQFIVQVLRKSHPARLFLEYLQMRFTPRKPGFYGDLFDHFKPSLVITSSPGWRMDRYLLREATRKSIPTASVIMGWDNPSSYCLSGSKVDWITCWSDIQKNELIAGSDWEPNRVNISGIPSYDGYFKKKWVIPREKYFRMHKLDPKRKLLSYACSFTTFAPSLQNINALTRLINSDQLYEPCQLLIRLHPNHFLPDPLFAGERDKIMEIARNNPNVHVVEPLPVGGELGYYSGDDLPEKSSMMQHSDIFLTVYSTMVVECSIHETPIIAVCMDTPGGWNSPNRYYLPLSQIGRWPTHQRFVQSGAGRVAFDKRQLRDLINLYLRNPQEDLEKQRQFVRDECTYTDGSASQRTAGFILSLLRTK